jgi:hypothetical protein
MLYAVIVDYSGFLRLILCNGHLVLFALVPRASSQLKETVSLLLKFRIGGFLSHFCYLIGLGFGQ